MSDIMRFIIYMKLLTFSLNKNNVNLVCTVLINIDIHKRLMD